MRKILIGLLSIVMAFCIVGCGTPNRDDSTDDSPETEESSGKQEELAPEIGLGDNELPLVPID